MDSGSGSPGNQGFENLFLRHTDGLSGMGSAEVLFIKFVKNFPAGDSGLLHKPDSICFICHFITRIYYTPFVNCFPEELIGKKGLSL